MPRKYLHLVFALLVMATYSCHKSSLPDPESLVSMDKLKVSPGFNWETSRKVDFLITSDQAQSIMITSDDGKEVYHQGLYSMVQEPYSVSLNIPGYLHSVLVNGKNVSVDGNPVQVSLSEKTSATFKNSAGIRSYEIPMQGLTAAWHLDENSGTVAGDAIGSHHGTIEGGQWIAGIRGSALAFNGTTSRVQIPGAAFNPVNNSISFAFWVKLNSVGASGTFLFQNGKYLLTIDTQGRLFFTLNTPAAHSLNSGVTHNIADTDWHHVAMTYNGTVMVIFLDGCQTTTLDNTGNLNSSTSDIFIGRQGTTNTFTGTLDDILMYDRALSRDEILQIFGTTPDPGFAGIEPVSVWALNENGGNMAYDSKSVNHATISAAAWDQGISGSCLKFNGASGLVKAPTKINLDPVFGITMMAWAKTDKNLTTKIFQKGDWDGHGLGQGNWDGWGCQIRMSDNTTQGLHWGGGLPLFNVWYHLAMTYDGQQLKFYVNGQLRNSKAVTGYLNVNTRELCIGSDDGIQKFFSGSIDECKFYGRALDPSEIQVSYYQPGNAPDQDGDGVPNQQDNYPADAGKAFNNYYPSTGHGTLAFEDLWPGRGDYDFNDLVVSYRFNQITNAQNKVVEIQATIIPEAIGASYHNGFAFQLPLLPEGILDVTGVSLHHNYITLAGNHTEAGQSKAVIIAFDDAYDHLQAAGQGETGANTVQGGVYSVPDTIKLVITLNTPATMAEIGLPPYNPFIIINRDRGREVHLADMPPTSLADQSLFGTANDDSNPILGRYYKTANNLPWGLNFTGTFSYPVEKAAINMTYLKFNTWAESAGSSYPDWYLNNPGYRDASKVYSH